MNFIVNLTLTAIGQVGLTLLHNWPYLLAGILIAALLKRYIDAEKLSAVLLRKRGAGVLTSTIGAVVTPLCSCGTTAVVLGMMASTVPWAPIVAFMVASPLTSPEELLYSAGLFGWPFAATFFLASIVLGLAGGGIAAWFEDMGWLRNQARIGGTAAGEQEKRDNVRPADQVQPAAQGGPSSPDQPAAQVQPAAINQPAAIDQPGSSCGCGQAEASSGPGMPVAAAGLALAAPGGSLMASEPACGCSQAEPVGGEIALAARRVEIAQAAGACACSAEASLEVPMYAPAVSGGSRSAGGSRRAEFARSAGGSITAGGQYQGRIEALKEAEITKLLIEIYNSARQLLPIFLGFAFIGYFLNGLIPASWVAALFGAGSVFSVPLAATLGLPLYINTEGSLPLVRALLDQGMSQGAALAFLISGAGTSFGAMAGALTIARWRVVALVVGILWVGAIVMGYLFNLMLGLHAF